MDIHMPRPKGPSKTPIHIRVLDSTWDNIKAQADAKDMKVPTFIAAAVENKFGDK